MVTDAEIKKQTRKKLNIIDRLQGYAVRTFLQLLIHSLVAVFLASILGFVLGNYLSISINNFVAIISSTSAASGALLAISLALATFWARHVTDWRDRLITKLEKDQDRLTMQMEKSAKSNPEISRRLAALYLESTFYIPGQAIDMEKMHSARKVFDDWAKEQAQKSANKFDFGNLNTYESFEKHIFDASLQSIAMSQTLTQLHIVEVAGRSIATFSPLIITWVVIVIFTLVFAIIGGMSVIPESLNLPILVAPFYLFLIAIFALTKDVTAILRNMRILETGYEQAMVEFVDIRKNLI
jgi:cell division protein FtsL